ncbi:MAG: hypothetical protein IPF87_12125 [Gemmatimonadetes bacterium]|nr:hypothetical protein [Gemmatimonadota bacterium]
MDRLVELLFKYRPFAFAKGTLAFASAIPPWIIAVGAVVASGVAVATYLRHAGELSRRMRLALAGLRVAAIAVLALALARPVLVLSTSIQQRNVVAVVVDDSRSMQVRDVDDGSRGDVVSRLAGGADSALLRALAERYQLRVFRLGAGGRLPDASSIRYDGTRTRLAASILRIEDDLTGVPTAGVVLLSDGADNASATPGDEGLAEQLLSLRARQVPVYTVGIGSERFDRDVEVARVDAPRTLLRNASLFVQVVLVQRGYGGTRVPVVVEDSGRIVGTATALLPRDGEAVSVRIRVPATETGARLLTVKVPLQAREMIAENNARTTLVVVRDRREKILYMEGEPRFELKFLRRAVEADGNIQLVTLLRSSKDKFLRLGVDDSLELAAGFPRTREELFSYRAVVLGSVEASFFTADQLRMLGDFVSERGGGLLVLGGRDALGEGGYGGTAVSDALPLELQGVSGDAPVLATLQATPTAAGAGHAALQLAGDDSASRARWTALPPLTTVNRLGRAKPGATILLTGMAPDGVTSRPLLAYQRYGRGKAIVFGAQDSWLWQMEASIPVDDQTHETFWRQMLRWLVSDVPDRVETIVADESGPGEGVSLRAEVSDSGFLKANGATVLGTVTPPRGVTQEVALEWAVERDGEYRTTYVPDGNGVHEVRLRAVVGRDTVVGEAAYVRVAPPTQEYFGAEMRPTLLRQLAEETGGRYYPADRALDVAKDMVYSASGATVVERKDLWDMPVLLGLLLLALGTEWALRRRRGVA